MKENFKKIGRFLKGLEPVEYRYLESIMQVVSGLQSLIKKHELSQERFCELFGIKANKYEDYIKGNYNYNVSDMAKLNAIYIQLETEKIKQIDLIQVTDENI
jgi:transcriptional regulator with XRE-family HTH domain